MQQSHQKSYMSPSPSLTYISFDSYITMSPLWVDKDAITTVWKSLLIHVSNTNKHLILINN